jgi:hypothetical protein
MKKEIKINLNRFFGFKEKYPGTNGKPFTYTFAWLDLSDNTSVFLKDPTKINLIEII